MKILSVLALSICLLACSKTEVTPVAVTQPAPSLVVPSPTVQQPTTKLEELGAVKMKAPDSPKVTQTTVKPSVVKTSTTSTKTTHRKTDAKNLEKAAYIVAFINKIEYVCIKNVVDQKIAADQSNGEISDRGNVITYFHSVPQKQLAYLCIQNGLVKESDVKEFKGKF